MPHISILPNRIAAHVRLLTSIVLCILVYVLLPFIGDSGALRLALAWDAGTICFLVLITWMMLRSDAAGMHRRADLADSGRAEIVILIVAAAVISLYAVAIGLAGGKNLPPSAQAGHIAVGVATIFVSWLFIHTLFATHYAHLYYDRKRNGGKGATGFKGGLVFPEEPNPDYWDFVYFSFVLGMTFQVSDVQVTARNLRHLTTAHGIIAFFYNTIVLALAVSIAANLI